MERIKTQILLKRNLKALLKHRGITQAKFARHLAKRDTKDPDSWMSHILDEKDLSRELPMELWDKAAEKLGVDAYHFFIPGIADNDATERRSGTDRRKRADRRLGTALPATAGQLDLMTLIRSLPQNYVDKAIVKVLEVFDEMLRRRRGTVVSGGDPGDSGGTDAASHAQGSHQKKGSQA